MTKANIPRPTISRGILLPFEHHTIENGYASNGPIKTYHMDRDEILRRYGPIKGPRRVGYSWKKSKKESEKVETTEEYTAAVELTEATEPAKNQPDNFETYPKTKPKTRMEIARETLTKECYLAMKAEGKSDTAISKEIFGKYKPSIMTGLKREWGMDLNSIIPKEEEPKMETATACEVQESKATPEDPAVETELETETQTLTIIKAIELRDKLVEEVEILNHMLKNATGKLQQLQDVFEKETITI